MPWACPVCGRENVEEAKFCADCAQRRDDLSETWACVSCGRKNRSDARFCAVCGQSGKHGALPEPRTTWLGGFARLLVVRRKKGRTAHGRIRAAGLELDVGKGVTMTLALIPAGEFLMGSPESEKGRGSDEGPQRRVTIARPFYLGKYPVTQAQWHMVMRSNPSHFRGDDVLPVENVSWSDCREFCRRLSRRTGREIRLPTEAEWEYACRAGTTTPFHFGETISTDQANYDGNYTYGSGRKGMSCQRTVPVGSYPANPWGLHDMHGNVWEWCCDWYAQYAAGAKVDPTGPSSGADRVLRGGSWLDLPYCCRSAVRSWGRPGSRVEHVGMRVAAGA